MCTEASMNPEWQILAVSRVFVFAIGALACDSVSGPDYVDMLAMVDRVSLPDTVIAGQQFDVTIVSSGTNTCWKPGHEDVEEIENGYRITPWDREYVGPLACGPAIIELEHVVPLTITAVGTAEIQIRYRMKNGAEDDSTGTLVREVMVVAGL